MTITFDSANKHTDISLSNGDLTATIVSYSKGPRLALYGASQITANFAGSFSYSIPSGFSAFGSATLDSSNKHADITLSNGDLTAALSSGSSWRNVAATEEKTSGKWYFELTIDNMGSAKMLLGIAPSSMATNVYVGSTLNSYGMHSAGGHKYNNAAYSAYGNSYTTNDIIMVAMDLDNGKLWWGENGTWHASGNPGAGTNYAYNTLGGNFWRSVAITSDKSAGKWYFEFTVDNIIAPAKTLLGVDSLSMATNVYIGFAATGYGLHSPSGNKYNNATPLAYGNSYTTNDIIMVAMDLDNGKLWWGENGTWHASGNPGAGTNYAYNTLGGSKGVWASIHQPGQITINLAEPFTYTIPSGFGSYEPSPDAPGNFFLVL